MEWNNEISSHAEDNAPPRFRHDYRFAQLLVSGDENAWTAFYREYRGKLSKYIQSRYPQKFTDTDIEEICDGVQRRLLANNYRALREYKGECSFGRYLTEATEWELIDWMRANKGRLVTHSLDDLIVKGEVKCDTNEDRLDEICDIDGSGRDEGSDTDAVPPVIYDVLSDEVRWAFLLRYYDYFGFPPSEIRLLAKKRGILIKTLTERIATLLECSDRTLLESRRNNQQKLEERLQMLFVDLTRIRHGQEKLSDELQINPSRSSEDLQEKKEDLTKITATLESLERRRTLLLKQLKENRFIVKTPYEIVAEILGEKNLSTVRSRVLIAKRQLQETLIRSGVENKQEK